MECYEAGLKPRRILAAVLVSFVACVVGTAPTVSLAGVNVCTQGREAGRESGVTFGLLALRGGSAAKPTIRVLRSNSVLPSNPGSPSKSKPAATSSSQQSGTGTLFTKVSLSSKEANQAKKVEVCGSWSKFKERAELKKLASGDWELIIELPKGSHEFKFILDSSTWICSENIKISTDHRGNRNNILLVEDSRRTPQTASSPGAAASAGGGGAAAAAKAAKPVDDKVFVKDAGSIEAAKDVFAKLLEEEGKASERLKRAQSQLVDTLALELKAGLDTLTHCSEHIASCTSKGEKGIKDIKASAEAKKSEITAHVDGIRAVIAAKEDAAVNAVTSTAKTRLERLEGQVEAYNATLPSVYELIQRVKTDLANSAQDTSAFVDKAQEVVPLIEKMSNQLMETAPPVINDDFDSLEVDVAKEERAINRMTK